MRRTWGRRRRLRRLALPVVLLAVLAMIAPLVVLGTTASHRHSRADDVPVAPVAIVLGAGIDGSGNPSPFLAYRLDAAIELYRAKKVRALLMSGDHSTTSHDEVDAMARYTRARGVPSSAIVLDHAGFDTYSSCYRARSVWGIQRAIVITQAFHLPRSVFVCRELGVDAEGLAASDGGLWQTAGYGWVREVPAIDTSLLDLARGRTPMFPGPREHTLDGVTGAG